MKNENFISTRQSFVIFGGMVMILLGAFMISDVHTWEVFSVWLPLAALSVGVLMMGSKTYSTSLGTVFLVFAGLIWLHQSGVIMFPYITAFIDWMFVILGGTVIAIAFIEAWQNRQRMRLR